MPIRFPRPLWPDYLTEEGPEQDPSILLSGDVEIAGAPHRLMAVRVRPDILDVDYRADVSDAVYADYSLNALLEDLAVFDDIDASVLVSIDSGSYVMWMVPAGGEAGGWAETI